MSKNPIEELVSAYKEKKIVKYDYIGQMQSFNKTLFYLSKRLKNTDIHKIEIQDDLLLFTTRKDHIKLVFNGLDRRGVPFDILNFDCYEKEDEEVLFSLLKKNAVILDIGANIGWYSLLFSKRLPQSKIYAFEPIQDTYKNLVTNINLNKSDNIFSFNIGLSEKKGSLTYYYFPEGSVLASEKNLINCSKAKPITCQVDTLDTFASAQKLNRLDFIKCDVEGAEFSVIKGGLGLIKKFLPILFVELFERWTLQFNYHPNHVIYFLKTLGYKCFLANEDRLEICPVYKETEEERLNFFFLHSLKHRDLINTLSEKLSTANSLC
ncbi:FkbM family methyltransferase [Candidatus Rhabdochlamydia porcellionis]|jgi:FkbM family methyltransferase|uniref:Methyltransferase FkbM domain n=1 Tax=Candidatus Rhabdochlamydia porcellionis TaxID=225148 RepID=A0ABX8Z0G4_9BACT|nr:FkbM family methyltransferase [Candidatus Rhabdochlamydia porcellionis]QZA59160.1 Methyltransferase FkbM domain [Candidatus Rhabdochlamydia porcellionis]